MKILLIGRGKMGKLIRETAESTGDEVVAALGHDDLARLGSMNRVADVVIDFSRPEALDAVCEYVRRTGTPLVSGTTGYTPEQKRRLEALGSAAPVLWSANYSLGVAVFVRALCSSRISTSRSPRPTTTRRRTPPAARQSCCWRPSIPSTP